MNDQELNQSLEVKVAVLETILPRIEDELKGNSEDHKELAKKIDNISTTMITKDMLSAITTSNDNLKRKTDGLQYQLIGIFGVILINSLPGTQNLISSLLVNVLPHLL